MFYPKFGPLIFPTERREPGRYFQGFSPTRDVISDGDLDKLTDGVVLVSAYDLRRFIVDARRFRLLTSGDHSITVHENEGTPVGFFCGTREEVSEQIDAELAKEGDSQTLTLVGTCDKAFIAGDTWGTAKEVDLGAAIDAAPEPGSVVEDVLVCPFCEGEPVVTETDLETHRYCVAASNRYRWCTDNLARLRDVLDESCRFSDFGGHKTLSEFIDAQLVKEGMGTVVAYWNEPGEGE